MLQTQGPTHCWHTLYRRYGVNLPSSLTVFHPNASEFSSCPPESVCGTACRLQCLAAFLVSIGSPSSELALTPSRLGLKTSRTLLRSHPTRLDQNPITGMATFLHPCITPPNKYSNIKLLSIDYAFRPRLRYRLTLGGLPLPRKPWASGGRVSHSSYRYLC